MQKINVRNLLRMQKTGQAIRPLHIILGNRNLEKFGEIVNIPADSITYHPQFNAADELSFSVYKERNNEIEKLWDKIIDFKTVYVKEYDEWFEITVSIDDSENNTKKIISAKSLCEAELGQVILHNIEINTEDDIARDDYVESTIFYNPDKEKNSLLNRIFEKIPGYNIAYVDETLRNIQRSFSIDGTSIYDFLTNTLSQEIGCIFLFDSNSRSIYVYDMETCCLNCGYRSEDSFSVCPECNGEVIHEPYGKDTSIFIDKNNLGSDIQLTSDTDSIKNTFRVIGGDDLINATITNVNPNGSNYIYYFNNDTLSDMPQELQDKILEYNNLVNEYTNNKEFSLEASLVEQYNEIITYIKQYYPDSVYSNIQSKYIGWSNTTSVYYNIIDIYSYLNDSMMPTWKQQEKTAESQLALLTTQNLSPVSVTDVSKISIYTANNAVLAMAKAIIDTSLYKVEILDGSSLKSQTWTGKFKVKSYSDEDDIAENENTITVQINDDYLSYINQQVDKSMARLNDQGLKDIYKIELIDDFKNELHKYSAQQLTSYQSAYQTAINILTEQGTASLSSDLHDSIYLPYYNRLVAIESELSYRNSQIDTLIGLQRYIENLIAKTHKELNFQTYLGDNLWKLFSYYIREDDYKNENYVSDGLSNEELIQKANELITVARKELVKSGEKQFTISGTLQNLLLLTDKDGNRIFEPILDDFTLGNFIRSKIDKKIYVMRLADISISYSDLSKLSVTFSDAYKYGSPNVNIVKNILAKSQSMATSYSSTVKQASQGEKANLTFAKLQKEGLDSALYSVHNTNSTAIFDEHGILIRSYDDILDDYKDEQCRVSNNEFVFTTDKWRTAATAIGKQQYTLNGITYKEYGVNSNFVIAGKIISGDIYSANYTTNSEGVCTSGTHFNLNTGDCVIGGDKIIYDSKNNKLSVNVDEIDLTGKVNFNSFTSSLQKNWNDIKDIANDANDVAKEASLSVKDSINSVDIEYYKSTSSTKLINGEWSTITPIWEEGYYIWTRTLTTTIKGDKTTSEPVCISGNNGTDGIGISSITEQYYLSSSSIELVGDEWKNESPVWKENFYIWTRSLIAWDNNTVTTTTPVLAQALNNANENANVAKSLSQEIVDNIYTTNTTTIDGGKITTGSITADAIATDAIVSKNYIKNSTGSFLNLADGSFDSKYLKWDSTGNMTATSGHIGGWTINNSGLFVKSDIGTVSIFAPSTEQDTIIGITDTTGSETTVPFLLLKNGELRTSNIKITGGNINILTDDWKKGVISTHCNETSDTTSLSPYGLTVTNKFGFSVDYHVQGITTNMGSDSTLVLSWDSEGEDINLYVNNARITKQAIFSKPDIINITHYGQTKHPAMYTKNPVTFDWDGSWLRIYVDNTIVASWNWGEARWE